MWYVYILIDPRNDKIFYVGKGKKSRMSATKNINQQQNWLKKKYLEEIKKDQLEPRIEIVAEYDNETDALSHEKNLIEKYGRIIKGNGQLVNYSDGGDLSNTGWIPSDETRSLWSKQRKGIKQSEEHILKRVSKNKGKKRSELQKRNCLLASIKKTNPQMKINIIEELENTPYYHGFYLHLAKKYGCTQDLITRITNNIEIYKEALNEWRKK